MTLEAGRFLKALNDTGYMMVMVACVELISAVLFLLNRFVPLAVLLILPGIFNILMFHLFLNSADLYMAVLMSGLLGIIVACRKDAFAFLLKP